MQSSLTENMNFICISSSLIKMCMESWKKFILNNFYSGVLFLVCSFIGTPQFNNKMEPFLDTFLNINKICKFL